jgi:hypothetical protein
MIRPKDSDVSGRSARWRLYNQRGILDHNQQSSFFIPNLPGRTIRGTGLGAKAGSDGERARDGSTGAGSAPATDFG